MPSNDADGPLPRESYAVSILARRRLSESAFELNLTSPASFVFRPGQHVRVLREGSGRDYTMICAPGGPTLDFCIRHTGGEFTAFLSTADIGASLEISGPRGYFTYRPSERQPVLVATGTGIAPFVSFAKAGLSGYILLHGARDRGELYYEDLLRPPARQYVACISRREVTGALGRDAGPEDSRETGEAPHRGRVTDYLRRCPPGGRYDFYLCGRSDMIRDAIHLIDELFPGSFVYTEPFF